MKARRRAILGRFGLLIGSVVAFAICGELALRAVRAFRPVRPALTDDPVVGWQLAVGTEGVDTGSNSCGEPFSRRRSRDPYLIRASSREGGRSVLVIGDSYTFADGITSGQAFYDVFEAQAAGVSVFAAGVGGYGTAQEYLMLARLHRILKPEVVVWQVSGNDPINNVFDLERHELKQNNMRRRPYYDPETAEFRILDPSFRLGPLLRHSELTRFMATRLLELDARLGSPALHGTEKLLALDPERRRGLFTRGVDVAKALISRATAEYPDTKFVVLCTSMEIQEALFPMLATERLTLLPEIASTLAQSSGTDCRPADGHWNHEGHRLVGDLLAAAWRRTAGLGR